MPRPKNYISKTAAVENLRRLFAAYPDSDELALEELFNAAQRQDGNARTNRNWLANKMSQMKYYGLIRPLYSYGQRKKLVGLQLTIVGKEALGKLPPDINDAQNVAEPLLSANMSSDDLVGAIKAFRDNNPSFEVVFELRLKKPN